MYNMNGQYPNYQYNNYHNPPPQGSAGFGIASLVLGIISLTFACCIPIIPAILGFIGLILGSVGIKKGGAGRGMAIAGLVLSIISTIIGVGIILLLFVPALMEALPYEPFYYNNMDGSFACYGLI